MMSSFQLQCPALPGMGLLSFTPAVGYTPVRTILCGRRRGAGLQTREAMA